VGLSSVKYNDYKYSVLIILCLKGKEIKIIHDCHLFTHSFNPDNSIAPRQVHYCSETVIIVVILNLAPLPLTSEGTCPR